MEDGTDVEVFAAAGTQTKNEMRVLDPDEGEVEFQETVVVKVRLCQLCGAHRVLYCEFRVRFFLMPYIASTMNKAHVATLDIIADKVLQKRRATSACTFVIQFVLLTIDSPFED